MTKTSEKTVVELKRIWVGFDWKCPHCGRTNNNGTYFEDLTSERVIAECYRIVNKGGCGKVYVLTGTLSKSFNLRAVSETPEDID